MTISDVEPRQYVTSANIRNKQPVIDWDKVLYPDKIAASKAPPSKPIHNLADDLLDSWMVIEALSPESYKKPENLASDHGGALVSLRGIPPWQNPNPPKDGHDLYFLVFLGAVRLDLASEALIEIYRDNRPERKRQSGLAALGLVVLNGDGVPISETGLSISSFGWAYGRALRTRLHDLKFWPTAEEHLCEGLEKILCQQDDDGAVLPLSLPALNDAYTWLVANCGLPETQLISPHFAIRIERKKALGPPDSVILNSFLLDDLQRVSKSLQRGETGNALRRYLGIIPRGQDFDLLDATTSIPVLRKALGPAMTPLGRWPGNGREPLVLLQQAAVNLAFSELRDTGVFSVNGPPGTGKTTLLRDIVAGILVARAKAMSKFDNPANALKSVASVSVGQGYIHFYELDESLRGHEILVASSNNSAVENVSKELPLRKEIAQDLSDFRYFASLSDKLAGQAGATWGLIASVLGKSGNRKKFSDTAWWDSEVGLKHYLKTISSGYDPAVQNGGEIPAMVTADEAPCDIAQALERWELARATFLDALKKSETMIAIVQNAYDAQSRIDRVASERKQALEDVEMSRNALKHASIACDGVKTHLNELRVLADHERERERISSSLKPGFLTRLFRRSTWRQWQEQHHAILHGLSKVLQSYAVVFTELEQHQAHVSNAQKILNNAEWVLNKIEDSMVSDRKIVELSAPFCKDRLVSADLWQLPHRERQMFAPNFTDEANHLRDDVFVAAVKLHKAFIDANSRKLRHSFGLIFAELSGSRIPLEQRHLLPHLWSALFLLTPVISTTFASVGRMLRDLPAESIGWLLLDESGQARPQEAVGAIYRARRVVPVGDPLQVEPVVTLPLSLVEGISRHMGVDPMGWAAPYASVQTLADHASPYGAKIQHEDGEVRIGFPLLVHRRCDNPMFDISNTLAYTGMMVHATAPKFSAVSLHFGASRWFDIRSGGGEEKWSHDEGRHVEQMILGALTSLSELPDFFVVSPFRMVAQRMRQMLLAKTRYLKAAGISNPHDWVKDRVGTIHTFQGRQADVVILLLGAPAKEQNGARSWATSHANILNVAVSRAKRNLYIVGNKALWGDSGHMKTVRMLLEGKRPANPT
jgi:hypothetical protein